MIPDDAKIEASMRELIDSQHPPAEREKALRLGGTLLTELNTFFDEMTVVKTQKIADRDLQRQAEAEIKAALEAIIPVGEKV